MNENKSNNKPLVSIIIPTYKGSQKICRAMKSIEFQTYSNIEVIIVDDNGIGTDEQIKTMNNIYNEKWSFSFDYIKHEINSNGAVARNTGLKVARGEYISFLDDDDIYMPQKIEKSVMILEDNKEIDMCFTGVLLRRNNKYVDYIIPKISTSVQKELMFNSSMFGTGSNIFARANLIKSINGFNPNYIRHQDLEFMLRIFEKCKYSVIEEILIIKDNNSSSNIPNYERMKESKNIYHKDFKYIIDSWSSEERNEYFEKEKTTLLRYCFEMETKENIVDALLNVKSHRKITIKENILFLLSIIKINNKNMYYYLKKIYLSMFKREKGISKELLKEANYLINKYE